MVPTASDNDDDVLLMRRGLTVQLDHDVSASQATMQIPMRAVAKRFLTPDRMVFCWEGTAEWPQSLSPTLQYSAAALAGESVSMHERGWAMIKAVPNQRCCRIQMCALMTPGVSDDALLQLVDRNELDAALRNVVIPTYEQAFGLRAQLIENLLMDELVSAK